MSGGVRIQESRLKIDNAELTSDENRILQKRKNSFLSKKTLPQNMKENKQEEIEDKSSKLNVSAMKSQQNTTNNNDKKDFKSEKTVLHIIQEENNVLKINDNINNNSNGDIESQTEASPNRKRGKNKLKSGSKLKNSCLFLTNVADNQQQQSDFNSETNNLLTNNRASEQHYETNKISSLNLLHLSHEDRNNQSFKITTNEKKSVKKQERILFDLKEDRSENENNERKSIKDKSTNSNNKNTNNNDINNKIKIKPQKNKERSSFVNDSSSINENKNASKLKLRNNKELELNIGNSNFDSKQKSSYINFSDSDSDSSFINFNPKEKNQKKDNRLKKCILPPLRNANLESELDNKGKSTNFKEAGLSKNRFSNEKINKERKNKNSKNDYYAVVDEKNPNPNTLNKKDSECKLTDADDNKIKNKNEKEKENFSPQSRGVKANKNNIPISSNKKSNVYNLKLPKLVLHQKNKSHLDVIDSIIGELKTVGDYSSTLINNNVNYNYNYNFNNSNYNNNNPESYQNFSESVAENENEFYSTSEKKLKQVNLNRIKPKRLPLEIDKSRNNNNKQGLKSQVFLKNFFSKCKTQQKNISQILNDFSTSIIKNTQKHYLKNDPIKCGRKTILQAQSEQIDKEVFHMDYPQGIREQAISLKGPPLQGENKYLFENSKSPMVIGEVILRIDEDFAVRCKEVLQSRFIEWDEDSLKKISLAKEKKAFEEHSEKMSALKFQIEKQLEVNEKVKIRALKEMRYE